MRFFLVTVSRPALGPTQTPIQWVRGALTPAVKRLGRETHHSPPPRTEVKNAWSLPPLPNTSSWRGNQLSTGKSSPLPYYPLNVAIQIQRFKKLQIHSTDLSISKHDAQ